MHVNSKLEQCHVLAEMLEGQWSTEWMIAHVCQLFPEIPPEKLCISTSDHICDHLRLSFSQTKLSRLHGTVR